jgi:hypothetical protein
MRASLAQAGSSALVTPPGAPSTSRQVFDLSVDQLEQHSPGRPNLRR